MRWRYVVTYWNTLKADIIHVWNRKQGKDKERNIHVLRNLIGNLDENMFKILFQQCSYDRREKEHSQTGSRWQVLPSDGNRALHHLPLPLTLYVLCPCDHLLLHYHLHIDACLVLSRQGMSWNTSLSEDSQVVCRGIFKCDSYQSSAFNMGGCFLIVKNNQHINTTSGQQSTYTTMITDLLFSKQR